MLGKNICYVQAHIHVHSAPFWYMTVVLLFQGWYPRVLCISGDALGITLLCAAGTIHHLLYHHHHYTYGDYSPSHLSLLSICIENMEQVHDDVVVLLLLLMGPMYWILDGMG